MSAALGSTLRETNFTRVTVLAPPPEVPREEFERWPQQRREEYWLAASASAGADLVLTGELRVEPRLSGSTNEKFWLNLPLFILGGPACYFIDDRSYKGDARLDVWLYDLRPMVSARESFQDGRSELAQLQSRFRGTTLDFIDRVGNDVTSVATSIVVPAGLLARRGSRVEHAVADKAIHELSLNLAHEIDAQQSEILIAKRVSSFYVDPASTLTSENGALRFRGAVILRRGEIERMDAWRLEAGGQVTEGELDDPHVDTELTTVRSRYLRYPMDVRVPATTNCREAKLTVVGAGRNPTVRTFTFTVSGHEAAELLPAQ